MVLILQDQYVDIKNQSLFIIFITYYLILLSLNDYNEYNFTKVFLIMRCIEVYARLLLWLITLSKFMLILDLFKRKKFNLGFRIF